MTYFQPTKYIKKESHDPIYKQLNLGFVLRTKILPAAIPTTALFLIVTQLIVPLVFFTTQNKVSSPVYSTALGTATGYSDFRFDELSDTARVLGKTTQNTELKSVPAYFNITIPKLNITNATVETNAPTLNPEFALGHYANSALPGENGNAFIYGHSVLPIFYNPKNYKTIFSTLHKLDVDDEFFVNYNEERLTYKVIEKRELKPEQVDPLAEIKPAFLNESTLVLMTCSPPGTKIKRLLVDSVLVKREFIAIN